MSQQTSAHPFVTRTAKIGAMTLGFAAYRLHSGFDLPPMGAGLLGACAGWVLGAMLGAFVVDEDGNIRTSFAAIGGLSGAVLALAAAGSANASGMATAISMAVGAALGSAFGRILWLLLAIVAALAISIGPRLMTHAL